MISSTWWRKPAQTEYRNPGTRMKLSTPMFWSLWLWKGRVVTWNLPHELKQTNWLSHGTSKSWHLLFSLFLFKAQTIKSVACGTQYLRNGDDHGIFESMEFCKQQIVFILFTNASNNLNFCWINCWNLEKKTSTSDHNKIEINFFLLFLLLQFGIHIC